MHLRTCVPLHCQWAALLSIAVLNSKDCLCFALPNVKLLAPLRAQGVAGLWGGNAHADPLPPRCLTLGEFAQQSVEAEAVVVPAARGWLASSGVLAQTLQDCGAIFAGAGALGQRLLLLGRAS